MRTGHWIDGEKWKLAGARWKVIACAAAVALYGCDRGARPNPASQPSDAGTPTAETKPAEGARPPEAVARESLPLKQAAALSPTELGQRLYAQHCAQCHGERGDGKGVAATFLFPKPRDFRAGRFRLVSTNNNVPTREDLLAVLARGMPGSSMPPWAHLKQQERDALVDEVIRLRREGAREAYIQSLKEDEGLTDQEIAAEDVQSEIRDYVDEFTTPGDSTDVPAIGQPTPEAIARGRDVYAKFVCISCHGVTGRGDGVQEMWDDEKMPTSPRDFTLGIFKGDPDPASVYRRIAYGMPGTPMPSSSGMTPEQMVDLVQYVRSMSSEEQRQAAVLKREEIVVQRVDAIPGLEQQDAWSQVTPVQLRTMPLWWRNDAHPDLTVQAVHDGKTLAVRLTWQDETPDQHAVRSESFEDAVAMELFRGEAEPFLGMGDATSPVDVWFWDADRQRGTLAAETLYPNAVVDVYPFNETVVASAELSRPGGRMANQPDVSLPARASGNLIVPTNDESGGTSLHVGGPGSVTFRIPQSQLVSAQGNWSNGRWTVVMTRSLAVASADDGVSLEPGGRAAVAFAVWDGSHHDRDGQKSVTVWQDLVLE
jgi:DMSO reductase family type II enzyme heme b subunit